MNPRAVVTGAARRVGRACAVELAAHGFDLVLHARAEEAHETASACIAAAKASGHGIEITHLQADLAVRESVERMAAGLRSGRIDLLVHNASIYGAPGHGSPEWEDAEAQFRVHALAPLLLTHACAGALRASTLPGGGAVVCMLDTHVGGPVRAGYAAYSMAKAALAEMVRALAVDLAPGVRVNGISPGVVAWAGHEGEAERAAYLARVPLAREGSPQDIARTVRFLALEAPYITGQVIRVDGGRSLR